MLPVFQKFLKLAGIFRTLSKGFHQIYLEMLWSMGTKNWIFKSSGRLDWTNTSNCVCIDYYSSCPCCGHRRLTEAYQYLITARLQSDPVERCSSQYRQISGDRSLNNFGEVLNSKRILRCRSLIIENKVTTGYISKLIRRWHCEKILLKAGDDDITNDA